MSTRLTKDEIRFIRERLDCGDHDEYGRKIEEIDRKLRLMELTASDTNAWTDVVHEIDGRTFIERTYKAHLQSIAAAVPSGVRGFWVMYSPTNTRAVRWRTHEVINRPDFSNCVDLLGEYPAVNGSVILFEV